MIIKLNREQERELRRNEEIYKHILKCVEEGKVLYEILQDLREIEEMQNEEEE